MLKIKRLYSENSIFRFMISYAGVLLIPLSVCLLSYQMAFDIVKEDIKESNLVMLRRSKTTIDEQMRVVNSLMMQTVNNERILSFADQNLNNPSAFYYEAKDAITELAYIFRYADANIVNNVYIYLKDSNYVMTRYDLYEGTFFHDKVLNSDEGLGRWTRRLVDKNYYEKCVLSNDKIEYVQMLPFTMNKPIKGSVVCVLDKNALASFCESLRTEENSNLYIRDKEGNILFSLGQEGIELPALMKEDTVENVSTQRVNGKKSMVLNLRSDENGWIYTLVLPEEVVMYKLSHLKKSIMCIFTFAIAIGILISYYMANKSGRPIEDIKKSLGDMLPGEEIQLSKISSTSTLSGTVEKVVSRTQVLREELEKQKPYLKSVLFQKLIKGEFANEQELNFICQRAGVDLSAKAFHVVSYRIFANNDIYNLDAQTLEDVSMIIMLIQNELQKVIEGSIYFWNIDQLTSAVIIKTDYLDRESLKKCIASVNKKVEDHHKVKPFWGISDECSNLLQIWRAFEEAKKALKMAINKQQDNVVEYSEIIEDVELYYYPIVFEKQLITYTREGNGEGIVKLIDMLYIENFEKRKLPSDTITKLYTEIKSTIFKLTKQDQDDYYIEKLKVLMEDRTSENIRSCFEEIKEVYIEISSSFKEVKKSQQDKLIHQMLNYIDENYANSNLGLGMVATKFNISEGYVSSLFKEQAGINFTDYVERQRINTACELLKRTTINISEISEQVGYNSVQSFRRAFKRIYNFSPSELRKNKELEE